MRHLLNEIFRFLGITIHMFIRHFAQTPTDKNDRVDKILNKSIDIMDKVSSYNWESFTKVVLFIFILTIIFILLVLLWFKVIKNQKKKDKKDQTDSQHKNKEIVELEKKLYTFALDSIEIVKQFNIIVDSYQNIISRIQGYKSQLHVMNSFKLHIKGFVSFLRLNEILGNDITVVIEYLQTMRDVMSSEVVEDTYFKILFDEMKHNVRYIDNKSEMTIQEYIKYIYNGDTKKNYLNIQLNLENMIIAVLTNSIAANKKVNYVEVRKDGDGC